MHLGCEGTITHTTAFYNFLLHTTNKTQSNMAQDVGMVCQKNDVMNIYTYTTQETTKTIRSLPGWQTLLRQTHWWECSGRSKWSWCREDGEDWEVGVCACVCMCVCVCVLVWVWNDGAWVIYMCMKYIFLCVLVCVCMCILLSCIYYQY